ncbi:Flavin containing amine oxidoreductase [Microbacterium sp. LKL04]|uniref:NAD(P)/FAD-dependent oxidoreductase n=1 Tax=Microbacterium sp. LKL04 TaxID=912630 RepID=UPI000875B99F|nr:NAD(P)/FAD-dependent oxidoreductase [Microbacterium sp. LKL04]SCX93819.1 Flavin containing amine oxidoreductase [Microbacterium sp. LKL04]
MSAVHDVAVVGAGLAGLRAATLLARAGRDVVVVEAQDEVGGRQRTDRVDGFLLDRGFQVINPRYDALARAVDPADLDLRSFPVGVRVVRGARSNVLAHPVRHPGMLPATVAGALSGLVAPADVVGAVRWLLPALVRPASVAHGPDETLHEAWGRAGLTGPLRRSVLEPFLTGVLADDGGETSAAYATLIARLFAVGRPGVPAAGVAVLPRRLAELARAAGAEIRLSHPVDGVTVRSDRVELEGGVSAREVIVAVGGEHLSQLTGEPAPPMRGLQTWWFGTGAEAPASALLAVDGERAGPIVNSVVMSRTAPGYAPEGRHLVAASCLLRDAADEAAVHAQLARMWGDEAASWELLRRDDIPHALPALAPPMRRASPVRLSERVIVAGDHRETPSIAGALVSGERAAAAVLGQG